MKTVMSAGEPMAAEKLNSLVEEFHRDGFARLGPVFTPDEVAAMKAAIDRKLNDEQIRADEKGDQVRGVSLMRMFEYDTVFRDLIVREPLPGVAEAILGADCHVIAQNALRTERGEAISAWHVDDRVLFPLPPEIPRYDPRMRVPCFIANLMVALTDVDELEHGPTQAVPGSHYSGREPDSQDNPTFEGRGAVSLFVKAGEAYIFHNQTWHRGAPNDSDRVRYVTGAAYGQRTVSQRFFPFLNYRMPDSVIAGASPRLLRFLGKHEKGAYG